jgi:hypothetical protein
MTRENRRRDRRDRSQKKLNTLPPGMEGGHYRPLAEALTSSASTRRR